MSRVRRFTNNVIIQAFGYVVGMLFTLIVTPFILKNIDLSVYGVYVLALSIISYFSLVEFGMGAALVKYISEFVGAKRWNDVTKYLNFSLFFYFIIGLVAFLIVIIFSFFYEHFFYIDPKLVLWGRFFLWIEGLELFITLLFTPFRLTLDGFQRVDIRKNIDILLMIVKFPLVFLVFKLFLPIYAFLTYIILSLILMVILSGSVYIYFFKKYFAIYKLKLFFYERKVFNTMIHFSALSFILQICDMVIQQSGNIIVGAVLGAKMVTFYSIGLGMSYNVRTINSFIGWPIYLMIANIIGEKKPEREEWLMHRGTKLYTAFFVPITILLIIFFDKFITLWVGPEFSSAIPVGRILLLVWFFGAHMKLIDSFLVAKAILKQMTIFTIFQAIANVTLSIILVKIMGIQGVALGVLIPYVLFGVLTSSFLYKKLKLGSLWDFMRKALFKNVIFYLLVTISGINVLRHLPAVNLWQLIGVLGILYAVCGILYLVLFCDNEDKILIKRLVYRK